MSKFQTFIKNKQNRYREDGIKEVFKKEDGAIDLASIMVGIIVIGLIGGVIAATVFAVIPWAQDNAAKQQLDSIVQAENAYFGLSAAVPSPLPAGYTANSFTKSAELEAAGLLKTGPRYCATTPADGKSYTGFSQSSSGSVWSVTNQNSKPVLYTGTLPTDCQFITEGHENSEEGGSSTPAEESYVDPTPLLTKMTFKCDVLTTVSLPMTGRNGSSIVSWDNGTPQTYSTSGYITKILAAGQQYTVTVEGTYTNFTYGFGGADTSAKCLRSVDHWGSETGVTYARQAFYKATNLTSVPAHIPPTINNMMQMFEGATSFNDPDISNWNVAKVTKMDRMFYDATSFNQPLNNWKPNNVNDMSFMFYEAEQFNQPLTNWNTSKVTNMAQMFNGASAFNQNLSSWDTSAVIGMGYMFGDAFSMKNGVKHSTYNKTTTLTYKCDVLTTVSLPMTGRNGSSIASWDDGTSATPSTSGYITKTLAAGQQLTVVVEGTYTNFTYGFGGADTSAKCLRSVDHWGSETGVTYARQAFYKATNLTSVPANIPSTITTMMQMFEGATSFNNLAVSNWNVAKVTNMDRMFYDATSFNQPLNNWNTASLTSGTLFAPASFPDTYLPPKTSK